MACPETKWPSAKEYMADFAARTEKLKVPLSGSLELTHRCNLNCVHCYLGPRDARLALKGRELGTSRVLSLLDEITEAGCLNLLLTGGEPFLREDFREIYRHAKRNGLLVTVFTNGTMVTDGIIKAFTEFPPFEVEITLYGATAGTYERVTRVPGSYEKCLQAIRGLLDNGVRVNLKTILMTVNRHEFTAMEKIAKDFGVRFRFDAAISPRLDGDKAPLEFRVSPEEAIEREMSDPGKVRSWIKFLDRFKGCALGPDLYSCNAGVTVFHVDPFGGLMPCMTTLDIKHDISEAKFPDGWNDISARIRKRKAVRDFVCNNCEKINLCGYCPAVFKLENSREDVPSEYLCRMANLRLLHINNYLSKGELNGQRERAKQEAAV